MTYIADFARNLFKKQHRIIGLSILNTFIIAMIFDSLILGIIIYAISLPIALSPIGEWILQIQTGNRSIKRQDCQITGARLGFSYLGWSHPRPCPYLTVEERPGVFQAFSIYSYSTFTLLPAHTRESRPMLPSPLFPLFISIPDMFNPVPGTILRKIYPIYLFIYLNIYPRSGLQFYHYHQLSYI